MSQRGQGGGSEGEVGRTVVEVQAADTRAHGGSQQSLPAGGTTQRGRGESHQITCCSAPYAPPPPPPPPPRAVSGLTVETFIRWSAEWLSGPLTSDRARRANVLARREKAGVAVSACAPAHQDEGQDAHVDRVGLTENEHLAVVVLCAGRERAQRLLELGRDLAVGASSRGPRRRGGSRDGGEEGETHLVPARLLGRVDLAPADGDRVVLLRAPERSR